MSSPGQEFVEVFLQEASEHLQFLREYGGILLDPYPAQQDLERLYVAAHTLKGSSAMYAFPLFSEIAAKLAHIFQYAMNVGIASDAAQPLVEFISEAVAVLESDLWTISSNSTESAEEIESFKAKYPFAFQPVPAATADSTQDESSKSSTAEPIAEAPTAEEAEANSESGIVPQDAPAPEEQLQETAEVTGEAGTEIAPCEDLVSEPASQPEEITELVAEPMASDPESTVSADRIEVPETAPEIETLLMEDDSSTEPKSTEEQHQVKPVPQVEEAFELPPEGELPSEIMEFFVPEVEEHMQTITECLLKIESDANDEDINRLFRSMHTIKGSAAQVGLPRISLVAHRAEDLIGRLRDGALQPGPQIIDVCLETVDTLKKFLYRQWTDDASATIATKSLLDRIARLAPGEVEEAAAEPSGQSSASAIRPEVSEAPVQSVEPGPFSVEELLKSAEPEKAEMQPSLPVSPARQEEPVAEKPPERAVPALREPTKAEVAELKEIAAELEPLLGLKKQTSAVPQSRSVRIALERLDRMMNSVGELVINRTRMIGRLTELERLADVLNFSKARMTDKVTEFQEKYEFSRLTSTTLGQSSGDTGNFGQSKPASGNTAPGNDAFPFRSGYSSYAQKYDASLAEFSELEMDRYDEFSILSRSLTEISADITEILTQLDNFVRRVDSDIDEFTKLAHRLQDEITAARMVPIGNLYTRISRTVRDAAKAAGKQVELQLKGADTELDNNIIQQIADPLLHLVRNAVAHGIESAEERYELGKPDAGTVYVRAYHRGNHIFVEVEDDGRGLDYEKIRNTAVEQGLYSAEDASKLGEHDLQSLLFHPGFSTAAHKTELAGRGVGMDVVQSNINALNGEIEIETQKGMGTRFTLKVPLTLIISQALFVRCGQNVFAFPLAIVEEIRRIRESDLEEVGGKLMTKVRDVVTEVVRLDEQLGLEPIEDLNGFFRLVIVNVAGRQVGIVVEEVLRKDEIVIKNLGEYLRNVKLFPGATIAPDGSLILLLDVNRLVAGEAIERRPLTTATSAARLFFPGASALASGSVPKEAIELVPEEKVVVLVDDSISVRKFVGRMLEKAGYRVKLASDGLEALEVISQTRCNLVITDLEMPRTNGYELMSHLRQNPDTQKVPVMVVTSRAGMKHRDKAMKQGAVEFMVKPVQEEQFIATVERLIGPAKPPVFEEEVAPVTTQPTQVQQ